MTGRRHRAAGIRARSNFLERSQIIWIPLLFFFLGIVILIFNPLPQIGNVEIQGLKSISSNLPSLVSIGLPQWLKIGCPGLVSMSNYRVPAWIPVWKIRNPKGTIDRRLPPVSQLDEDAHRLLPLLDKLKEHKFFRIFKTDLSKECPFWARHEMCTSPGSCQICECDDDQIPRPWKMKPIKNFVDRNHYKSNEQIKPWGVTPSTPSLVDDVDGTPTYNEILGSSVYDDFEMVGRNPLTVSDERSSTASYVDLTLNRPGFTAYRGRNIWGLIYKENCMPANPREGSDEALPADGGECTEEEAFYKIISGMQTVIMVLSAEYHDSRKTPETHLAEIEELKKIGHIVDASTFRSQFLPDLALFKERVAGSREWMENLYFTFGILLKTFCNVGPILRTCDCDTGSIEDDALAREKLNLILDESFHVCGEQYRNGPLFRRKQNLALRQFQNISRIMDCLECEKCRLHGKVKILALQVVLKAAGGNGRIHKLERNEVIALVNALEYFSDGIVALHRFKKRLLRLRIMWTSSIIGAVLFLMWGFQQWERRRSEEKQGSMNEKGNEISTYSYEATGSCKIASSDFERKTSETKQVVTRRLK